MRWMSKSIVGVMSLLATFVRAQDAPALKLEPRVMELLYLDPAYVLPNIRPKDAALSAESPQVVTPTGRVDLPQLVGIYGTRHDLTAWLQMDGQQLVFKQGDHVRLSHGVVFYLHAISSSCVRLEGPKIGDINKICVQSSARP